MGDKKNSFQGFSSELNFINLIINATRMFHILLLMFLLYVDLLSTLLYWQ